jgi:hypothetical protein
VLLILGGFLENVVRLVDVEGYAGLLVDPAEVRATMAQHMVGLSASDAFGKLRIPKETAWALTRRCDGPRLTPIIIPGPNGRHCIHRSEEQEVARFFAQVTTVTRLAGAVNIKRSEISKRLKAARVRPVLTRREMGVDLYLVSNVPDSCVAA